MVPVAGTVALSSGEADPVAVAGVLPITNEPSMTVTAATAPSPAAICSGVTVGRLGTNSTVMFAGALKPAEFRADNSPETASEEATRAPPETTATGDPGPTPEDDRQSSVAPSLSIRPTDSKAAIISATDW
jgi:hypothetical protein